MNKAVITFDDGFETDYTEVYPLFKERGINGTSYVIVSRIGKRGYLDWTQIKEMAKSGWDFQSHTYYHDNLKRTRKSCIYEDFRAVRKAFNKRKMIAEHFAYPFNEFDPVSQKIVKEYYLTARSGKEAKGGLHEISSQRIHNEPYLKQIIDESGGEGESPLFLHTHDVKENHSPFGVSPQYLAEILDHLDRWEIITVKECYETILLPLSEK